MNKKIIYSFITLMVLATTSCGNDLRPAVMKNAMLSIHPTSYEDMPLETFVVEVNTAMTINLIESNDSFILYFGNSYCGSCEAVRPSLIEYIDKTGALIFHYDNIVNVNEYDLLVTSYPEVFPQTPSTPTFFFFEKGELVALREGSVRMFEYSTFKPLFDGLVKVSSAAYSNEITNLESLVSTSSALFFFFDRQDSASSSLWVNTIIPIVEDLKKPLFIFDVTLSNLSLENIETLNTLFAYQDQSGYIALIQDGTPRIIDSISLDASSETDISNWLIDK